MLSAILSIIPAPMFVRAIPIDAIVRPGPTAEMGDRYSVRYTVCGPGGKTYLDSERRGLAFSKVLGDGCDPYIDRWVRGMSVGSLRKVAISAEELSSGLGGILPPRTDLVITIDLVALRKHARP